MKGHEECKITHICIVRDCEKISRYICDKCISEESHVHEYYSEMKYNIEIEKFM